MTDEDTFLALENVSKRYETGEGSIAALEGIDLSVHEGGFVSLVGPSGCGKTTLLRLVAGLESPSSGRVRVGGDVVTGPDPDRGLVFQSTTLYPWRTVAENVRFGLEVDDTSATVADRRVERLLSLVGLADRADAYPSELSGGMRTRVGIARALAPDPEVLLLDEPFSDLDVATRESLQEDLLGIWNDLDKTVVLVTHTVGEAVRLSDAVVVFDGRGTIGTVVDVDLDRPRDFETDRFDPYVSAIRNTIRDSRGTNQSTARRSEKHTTKPRH
ncbi:ABC-type nitrate/sulfonate/bicarbonate transportsystem, ATPase component [Halapricum desulfuricans]|uniref:ABC-type nitrate/sulfonate/bicarbonate transportsystem, ATPase component n=1 Tax=Halapricum desulfuricans TaxID=2841257 RepID=A0A897NLP2_9EURY|nr:ABC transporter ATP-binding protein [Halapricum desulfuricans]QSG11853.1 ABC-type nitrate/sulfonate/bicarbonate transportsystem, ATPase component [Halapricum desulfuricans]